ncbi:hypothetical protein HD806DRAFT_5376 [Xylariaceae sp. AK1471]|nr:hypothetical protein HD806DRAFT_5376 [Xylariaceae sp. AK1471]
MTMDPVSLTLGILPLVGGAIKAYGGLHKKLKCFCHYSREVRRARKQFDRQRQFFHNEIHLLIRPAVEDESAVESMLDDPSHAIWESQELERSLKKHLGQNYGACLDVIEEIGSSNEELLGLMECFNEVESQRQKGEPMKDAVRRLRDRTKVAWDKSKFDASIASLRSSNDDLRRLRQQAIELQKPATQLKDMKKHVAQEYSEYKTIRRASKALHAALTTAWSDRVASCSGETVRHDVKLFVDAKVKDGVQMDMTVFCFGPHTLHVAQRTMTRLQVKSQVIDWIESGLPTPPPSDSGRQKRRKVRFSDESAVFVGPGSKEQGSMVPSPEGPSILLPQSENLSGKDLCSAFTKKTLRPTEQCSSMCLGFIDNCSEETFRHSLYHVAEYSGREPQHTVSMYQIMNCPVESSLSVIDQLKLARNLVTAVLKFHSTPWLGQYFALNDLSVFQSTPDLSTCLQTLHFGAGFITTHPHDMRTSSMDSLESSSPSTLAVEAIEDAKLQYGIRNLTLWCLGTILLQIGRWAAVDSPDDVLTIRKLSSQAPVLGPRYQALTKRCLECDFGYGEDLSKPRLQQAVHENVVCELSDMINSLDINA